MTSAQETLKWESLRAWDLWWETSSKKREMTPNLRKWVPVNLKRSTHLLIDFIELSALRVITLSKVQEKRSLKRRWSDSFFAAYAGLSLTGTRMSLSKIAISRARRDRTNRRKRSPKFTRGSEKTNQSKITKLGMRKLKLITLLRSWSSTKNFQNYSKVSTSPLSNEQAHVAFRSFTSIKFSD
jgi:hypothetical protein